MPTLIDPPAPAENAAVARLQSTFVAALFQPDAPVPGDVAGVSGTQKTRRFNVYRNNVHASLAAALAARFPVVQRLVGDEFFRAMAVLFIEKRPPASPVLHGYGADFAGFIASFEPARDLPYLADIARLEWARSLAYHAADDDALAIAALGELPADSLADARLSFHPAATLVTSDYPIVTIWRTNTHDEVVQPVGPRHGAECALVTRPQLDVLITGLPVAGATFVDALQLGATLGEAASAATLSSAAFDLPATLALLFLSGAIDCVAAPASPLHHRTQP